jgi:hypothetical protein
MSEDRALVAEVAHLTAVGNAVATAMDFDALQIARGLVVIATVMAEQSKDPAARVAVAKLMMEHARELDADIIGASSH